MQHKMRRFKQLLSEAETKEILRMATHGILSLVDADGMPYGVPLSFVYDGGDIIYFHCARAGHKIPISAVSSASVVLLLSATAKNWKKVSFCSPKNIHRALTAWRKSHGS